MVRQICKNKTLPWIKVESGRVPTRPQAAVNPISQPVSRRLSTIPAWITLSAILSGLFFLVALLLHRASLSASSQIDAAIVPASPIFQPEPESRYRLTYEQWVSLLKREAKVAAKHSPKRLTVLAGDSLSLWFPPELLSPEVTWLNQGISGETSTGLLKRLRLFDDTQPESVFVMIGINDLLRGVSAQKLLANQRGIIRHLKMAHPHAQIVVQSILPHAGHAVPDPDNPQSTVVGARLAAVSNRSIRALNQQLAAIAKAEGIKYLNLYPNFSDTEGNLRPELSTDGLHLSSQGYRIWASRLKTLNRPEKMLRKQ
ncbi:MAG: GDSL-type esterase/lipase family protein [Kovacikia sp.]